MCIRDSLTPCQLRGGGTLPLFRPLRQVHDLREGQRGLVSVSYTHLDVYKRQAHSSAARLMRAMATHIRTR